MASVLLRIGLVGFLLLFFWGVNVIRQADRREREAERRWTSRPYELPQDEHWQPHCPQCGEPYMSWSYTPAVVGLRGQTLHESVHVLRCKNGHTWP